MTKYATKTDALTIAKRSSRIRYVVDGVLRDQLAIMHAPEPPQSFDDFYQDPELGNQYAEGVDLREPFRVN